MAPQDRRWEYAPDSYGLVDDISDTLVCREGRYYLVTDANGSIPAGNTRGLGVYAGDTRHLSGYEMLLNGGEPLVLMSAGPSGFSQEQVLGNRRGTYDGQEVSRGTIEITRQRIVANGVCETLGITNHNIFDVTVVISYRFQADFADIFEVRGHVRQRAGNAIEPSASGNRIEYRYLGSDGEWRRTAIEFSKTAETINPTEASFQFSLKAGTTQSMTIEISTDWQAQGEPVSLGEMRKDYASWREGFAGVHTDNELFNEVLERAIGDLRTLWTIDSSGDGYFAAGVPWYATLFGRDAIITSLQTLPFRHELSRECLLLLARHQAMAFDATRAEEPGKILHEMRDSELTRTGELPYKAYYGSVDSTPLFLLLTSSYYAWTADMETIRELHGAITAAVRWILDFGRAGGGPYVRYRTDSSSGLRNQGWKDSADGIIHADGTVCEGPIALAEVQGYTYAAFKEMAPILRLLAEDELAAKLDAEAANLRDCFNADFWLEDEGYVALALDGDDRQARVMTSNAGQVLWSGILDSDRADRVRRRLFQNDMFSGWGIRTLSSRSIRYFPLGYHVGTVWPHDNGLIGLGLKRYGFSGEVTELLTALFDAAQRFADRRLPELFGGQPRGYYLPPVPYPVACRPQAWAAGSLLHLLTTTLGLRPDASRSSLHIHDPRLPHWLERLQLRGLRVGSSEVGLRFERRGETTSVHIDAPPDLEVAVDG
ncbi:MAG TPA: glycogen debranching N-terminal domain-containing protein [Dehalococcoidia bacterium]|jgi:glycogen debranching enzyme|nr:glycogen debranching N-terminal domain-containing protein [Dehalococcoidia bacterium]